MERFWQDIRYGARLLWRFPGVTAAALLALALGTGVNTALFSIVNAVLLTPLPFPESNRLLQVWRTELPRLQYGSASYPRYVDWRARNRAFEEMGGFGPGGWTLTGRDAPERLGGARATASLFRTLGAPPIVGRYFTDVEDRPGGARVIVIGEQLWQRRFGGDRGLVGSTLTIDGEAHTVIGIAPAVYAEMWRVDAWVPLARAVDPTTRGNNFMVVVGRLKNGVTRAQAVSMSRSWRGRCPGRLYSALTAVFGLLAASLAIVGIYSVMSYTVAQRLRELAIRPALGASRDGLLRLVLREGFALSGIGIAVGLAGAFAASRRIRALLYQVSPTDPTVFAVTAARVAIAAVLGYMVPAFRASRVQPAAALRAE